MTPLAGSCTEPFARALESPVGSPPSRNWPGAKRAPASSCATSPGRSPTGLILPPLVRVVSLRAGIPREKILILVATGLHRPNEGEELREVVGSDEIYRTIRIENHFARDREAHVRPRDNLGRDSRSCSTGAFVEADLKIVTGLVEPHFMAGYSGGRKVVAPGIAYQDTILMFHSARILEHCQGGKLRHRGQPSARGADRDRPGGRRSRCRERGDR